MRHQWTTKQVRYLRKHWETKTDMEMAFALGLRVEQVRTRRRAMGLTRKTWDRRTPPEVIDTGKFFNVRMYRCWLTGELPKR